MGSNKSTAEAFAAIREGAVLLDRQDIADVPAASVAERLIELRRLVDSLELTACRHLARLVDCRGYEADGAGSAEGWLVQRCGMLASEAARRVDVARHMPRLGATVEAHRAGVIGFGQVQTIAGALRAAAGASSAAWTVEDVARRCEPGARRRLPGPVRRQADERDGRAGIRPPSAVTRVSSEDQLVEVG